MYTFMYYPTKFDGHEDSVFWIKSLLSYLTNAIKVFLVFLFFPFEIRYNIL